MKKAKVAILVSAALVAGLVLGSVGIASAATSRRRRRRRSVPGSAWSPAGGRIARRRRRQADRARPRPTSTPSARPASRSRRSRTRRASRPTRSWPRRSRPARPRSTRRSRPARSRRPRPTAMYDRMDDRIPTARERAPLRPAVTAPVRAASRPAAAVGGGMAAAAVPGLALGSVAAAASRQRIARGGPRTRVPPLCARRHARAHDELANRRRVTTMARTILVVDDNPKIVEVLSAYLTAEGFEVVTAADGPSALAAVARRVPDLALLDIMLPGVDGIELTRRFQREHDLPGHPRHGAHRRDRPPHRSRGRRRRLHHQAVQPARGRRARQGGAAPGRARRPRRDGRGRCASATSRSTRAAAASRSTGRPVELTRTEFDILATMARTRARLHAHAAHGGRPGRRVRGLRAHDRRAREEHPPQARRRPAEPALHPDGLRRRLQAGGRRDEAPAARSRCSSRCSSVALAVASGSSGSSRARALDARSRGYLATLPQPAGRAWAPGGA